MSNITDGRCWKELAPDTSPPLFQHGDIVFQAHHVGWIVCGFFTLVSLVASFWLINKHLQWYTNKREQRYIVRILFMVPLYAVVSFASYLFWNHATALLLIRDCYESTVLTSFFYLLLVYISPNPDEQKEAFRKQGLSREYDREAAKRGEPGRKWVFPFQGVKTKPADGMYFLQLMKWGVLQYCVIRPVTTLIAVTLNYMGLYCEDSYSPGWGHIYITVIVSISVSVAMYCLIQLYVPVSQELAPYKPLLKLFSVKAVVFLTFWQATGLSLLSMIGLIKDTKYMTADDINNGIAAILETFEMMCFAFLHFKAFTYRPYKPEAEYPAPPPERTPRLRSLGHAFDFRETLRELWDGCVYMWYRFRGKETDVLTRRSAVMEDVFGRSRVVWPAPEKGVRMEVEETVDVGGERQWLGVGDDYGYGLGYIRREKSEALEDQIEKELQKRGYTIKDEPPAGRWEKHAASPAATPGHEGRKRSWWRSIYERVSQSGPDYDEGRLSPPPRRGSRSRHRSKNSEARPLMTYDDSPPPSAIRTYRNSRNHRRASAGWEAALPELQVVPADGAASQRELPPVPEGKGLSDPTKGPSATNLAVSCPANRSDSVLGRLFPTGSHSDLSSINTAAVTTPSSESHRQLEIRTPVIKGPLLVQHGGGVTDFVLASSTEGKIGESFQLELPVQPRSTQANVQTRKSIEPSQALPRTQIDPSPPAAGPPPISVGQGPWTQSPLPYRPPPSHRPRRDQIVLPTPLSPSPQNAGPPPGLEGPSSPATRPIYPAGRRFSAPVPTDEGRHYSRPYSVLPQDHLGNAPSGSYSPSGDINLPRPLRRWSRDDHSRAAPGYRNRRTSAPPNALPTIPQEPMLHHRAGPSRAQRAFSREHRNDDLSPAPRLSPSAPIDQHGGTVHPNYTRPAGSRHSSRHDDWSRYPSADTSSPTRLTSSPVSMNSGAHHSPTRVPAKPHAPPNNTFYR